MPPAVPWLAGVRAGLLACEGRRAGHHRPGRPALGGAGHRVVDAHAAEALGDHGHLLAHRVDAGALPERVQPGQLPAAGGAQGDAAAAGTAELAADHQQPGVEDGGGVGTLGVLEERRVDRAGGVVEGQEDHPAPGPDRRGLGGDLDPGDQQLGLAAPAQEVLAAGGAERVEELGVGVDDVPAGVEAEDLELGAHPLLGVHLGQPAGLALAGLVAEVEGELHRGDRVGRPGRLRLGGGLRPDPRRGQRVPLGRRGALPGDGVAAVAGRGVLGPGLRPAGPPRPPVGRPARGPAGPLDGPGVPVELGHLEQQVAAGDRAAAADRRRAARCRRPRRSRRPAPAARRPAGRPGRGARSR